MLLKRLDAMNICVNTLLDPNVSEDVADAVEAVALEGLCESYHVLPEPGGLSGQAAVTLEAFSVVREARNQVAAARMRDQQRKVTQGPWRGSG